MSSPKRWRRGGLFVLALTLAVSSASEAMAAPGAVYTQTNAPAGNVVQKFDRGGDGELTLAGTFATNGQGLAALGGRQGAVELSDDQRFVFAVNAGSNTVTSLRVTKSGLEVADVAASGGTAPASVDEHHDRLYVLNSTGTANVTAFTVGKDGKLSPIAGGSRALPGADGAAQVSVAPDGDNLVVSERVSNRLETLPLDKAGRPGAPVATPSSGAVPFGFAFGHHNQLVVSEAGASTVSSYGLGAAGALSPITAALPVAQGAACWVAVSPNGKLRLHGQRERQHQRLPRSPTTAACRRSTATGAPPSSRRRRAIWTSPATAASCTPSAPATRRPAAASPAIASTPTDR